MDERNVFGQISGDVDLIKVVAIEILCQGYGQTFGKTL